MTVTLDSLFLESLCPGTNLCVMTPQVGEAVMLDVQAACGDSHIAGN